MGGLFEGLCDWPHETPAEASKSAQSASSVSDWTDETSAVLQAVCAESLRGIVWIPSAKVTWCAVCVLMRRPTNGDEGRPVPCVYTRAFLFFGSGG